MRKPFLFCSLVLLLAVLAMPVLAAETLNIVADRESAEPGESVVFTLRIEGSLNCTSIGLIPAYDDQVWELTEGACLAESASLKDFSLTDGAVMLFTEPEKLTGDVVTFTLQAKKDAPGGSTTVTGEVAAKNNDRFLSCSVEGVELQILAEVPETTEILPEVTEETLPVTEPVPVETEETTEMPTEEVTEPPVEYIPEDTAEHIHEYAEEWDGNATEHWRTCACGAVADQGAHQWTEAEGTLCSDCGKTRQPEPQTQELNKGNTYWWILPVVLVAVAAAGAVGVVFYLKKKKEETE